MRLNVFLTNVDLHLRRSTCRLSTSEKIDLHASCPGTLRRVWIDAVAENLLRLSTSEHTCVSILHQTQLFGTRCES